MMLIGNYLPAVQANHLKTEHNLCSSSAIVNLCTKHQVLVLRFSTSVKYIKECQTYN